MILAVDIEINFLQKKKKRNFYFVKEKPISRFRGKGKQRIMHNYNLKGQKDRRKISLTYDADICGLPITA